MAVIGGVASLQMLVLGFGVLRRAPAAAEPVATAPAPDQTQADPVPAHPLAAAAETPRVEATEPVVRDFAPPPTGPTEVPNPERTPPGANMIGALRSVRPAEGEKAAGSPAPPLDAAPSPIPGAGIATADAPALSAALAVAGRENPLSGEPILERLMSTGAELRASGNMQGALQAFREVETALPDHPRIQAELAATLGQMGLTDKARRYWERIEEAGPVVAGAYFPLAGQQLRGEAPPVRAAGAPVMKIGEVRVQEQTPTSEGQKVALRVIVDADPNARPLGDDLTLLVYFYDQVAGGEVKTSTADTSYDYPSAPYDWQTDGTEEIIVKYHQPVFTEEQKRELGERSYYGYAIELYYRDRIQDTVVMPEDIARLRAESATEPAPAGGFLGPENALFPESTYP
ncbi:MAG: hypothetical protein GXX91_03885 [Verrucomicrobiaceae bacterium]|nr:hypothetical protein [Verrucomicrobiaceae bacterium]